jgi:outer membrane biosynthesis protein TonB
MVVRPCVVCGLCSSSEATGFGSTVLEAVTEVSHAALVSDPVTSDEHADDAETEPQVAPGPRQKPWSAVAAGVGIFLLSGAFLYSLDLKRQGPSVSSATKPPILGLNDPATQRADQRESAARPRAIHCTEPRCSASEQAWCDPDGEFLGCCALGMVSTPTKSCVCAAGGVSKGSQAQCPPATANYSVAAAIKQKSENFKLCRDSALRRGPVEGVVLRFTVSPDGLPIRPAVSTTSVKDPSFEDCMARFIEEVRFPPPPDGWFEATVPWAFD